jgi:hypothetical protein
VAGVEAARKLVDEEEVEGNEMLSEEWRAEGKA